MSHLSATIGVHGEAKGEMQITIQVLRHDLHVVEYGGDDEEGPARCPRCRSSDLRPIVAPWPLAADLA